MLVQSCAHALLACGFLLGATATAAASRMRHPRLARPHIVVRVVQRRQVDLRQLRPAVRLLLRLLLLLLLLLLLGASAAATAEVGHCDSAASQAWLETVARADIVI